MRKTSLHYRCNYLFELKTQTLKEIQWKAWLPKYLTYFEHLTSRREQSRDKTTRVVLPNVHILFTLFIAEWLTTKTITFLLQLIKQLIPQTPGFSDTVVCCKQNQQNKNKAEVEMFICCGSGSGQQPQPEPCINMKHVLFTLKLMQFWPEFHRAGNVEVWFKSCSWARIWVVPLLLSSKGWNCQVLCTGLLDPCFVYGLMSQCSIHVFLAVHRVSHQPSWATLDDVLSTQTALHLDELWFLLSLWINPSPKSPFPTYSCSHGASWIMLHGISGLWRSKSCWT